MPNDGELRVVVKDLNKTYRRKSGSLVSASDNVSLQVRAGEFLVLLGPSGCGKTTLLRCVAGLETPETGTIRLGDRVAFSSGDGVDLPPERRGLSMMFQSYALWPHMNALGNVAFPLESRGVRRPEARRRAQDVLTLVGIGDLGQQYPSQMSGGQQQRVALARALVPNDGVILFDEPLSNVDAKVRQRLRLELARTQREIGFSAIYVTHDQEEALTLAHRIAVMKEGRISQLGTPQELYDEPASRYVANFLGEMNEIPGTVAAVDADAIVIDTSVGKVVAGRFDSSLKSGDPAVVGLRPERCRVLLDAPSSTGGFSGTIRTSVFLGHHWEHVVMVGDREILSWGDAAISSGSSVTVVSDQKFTHAFADG